LQVVFILAIIAWVGSTMTLLFVILKAMGVKVDQFA